MNNKGIKKMAKLQSDGRKRFKQDKDTNQIQWMITFMCIFFLMLALFA